MPIKTKSVQDGITSRTYTEIELSEPVTPDELAAVRRGFKRVNDSFSFEVVCAALNLETEYVRTGLLQWKANELRRASQGRPSLYRPPVRRVNGRRHRITGPREYYKKSA